MRVSFEIEPDTTIRINNGVMEIDNVVNGTVQTDETANLASMDGNEVTFKGAIVTFGSMEK